MSQIKSIFVFIFLLVLLELFYFDTSFLAVLVNRFEEDQRPLFDCDPIIRKPRESSFVKFGDKTYPMVQPNYRNESLNFTCLNSFKNSTKLVLFWTGFWWSGTFQYGLGPIEPFKTQNCPVWNCETTTDRSRLKQSDAVLVHINDFQNKHDLTKAFLQEVPSDRPPNQRWIYLNFEAPATNRLDLVRPLKSVFNMSATYFAQSDFTSIYHGDMKFKWTNESSGEYDRTDVHGSKRDPEKLAAAFISNCNTPSRRDLFIENLRKKVLVDVYGSCGNKACPSAPFQNQEANDCRIHIAIKHQVLTSPEKRFCPGYITEKFFRTINFDVIPVVFGLGDYSRFIPKSGYIDVRDFTSPAELGDYLIYLNRNKTAYNEYFKWKNFIRRDDPSSYRAGHFHSRVESIENFMCELCTQLQLETYFGVKKGSLDLEALFSQQDQCQGIFFK